MWLWKRWCVLAVFFVLYAALLAVLSRAAAILLIDPDDFFRHAFTLDWIDDELSEPYFWVYFAGPSILVAVTQVLFLVPIVRWKPKRAANSRSLRVSLIAIGLVASGLTAGLFLAVFELTRWLQNLEPGLPDESFGQWFMMVVLPILIAWAIWSLVIMKFSRRDVQPRALARLMAWLLGATLVEVLVVLPIDIMVRRRTNCYCETGTAHALGLAAWACLWLAGPGAVLAVMSRRRRLWSELYCEGCGYAKGPSPGDRCPECGISWNDKSEATTPSPQPLKS